MQTAAHCDATVYEIPLRSHVPPALRPLQSCTAMGAHAQALQYLSKLCSHPLLVLDPGNPVHLEAVQKATQLQASSPAAWKAIQPNLHQLHHAPKLEQLKQLLQVSDHMHSAMTAVVYPRCLGKPDFMIVQHV